MTLVDGAGRSWRQRCLPDVPMAAGGPPVGVLLLVMACTSAAGVFPPMDAGWPPPVQMWLSAPVCGSGLGARGRRLQTEALGMVEMVRICWDLDGVCGGLAPDINLFPSAPINLPRRTFTVTAQHIDRLKQRISGHTTSAQAGSTPAPSSFVAVVALAWVSFVRAKHPAVISADHDVYVFFFIDCRGRRGTSSP
ncbi:hypothetical protein ZWY2020_002901 [Hordeum vulgare]|nr:hypothetical protein ZWY2020_002901 [Hordeum vulgare]